MFEIHCPDCQASVAVSAAKAGDTVACPKCAQTIQVPKLGELRKLESNQSAATDSDIADGRLTGGRSFLFAALALVGLLCLLGAAFCAVNWFTTEAPLTTQRHIDELETQYAQINSAQLIREFEDITKFGVDVPTPYAYRTMVLAKQAWRNKTIAFGAFGLLAAFTAILIGRRRSVSK